jgi:hypothetical protein
VRGGDFERASLCNAKCFFLVSGVYCFVALIALQTREAKRNPELSFLRGDGMTLQARFNALAALLSFGFVIAVVLGMI